MGPIYFHLQSNGEMNLSTTPFPLSKEVGSDPSSIAHYVMGRHVSRCAEEGSGLSSGIGTR